MGKADKLITKIRSRQSDANFTFDELVLIARTLGLAERGGGKHPVIFTGNSPHGNPVFLNLQCDKGGKAKIYQVQQVRKTLAEMNTPVEETTAP